MWFFHKKKDVVAEMQATLALLEAGDAKTLAQLGSDPASSFAGMAPAERQAVAIRSLTDSIHAASLEHERDDHVYHSRDPLTGVIQSRLGEDSVLPQLQATGQGNPITWLPAGIRGLLMRYRAKHPFQTATAASRITIPDKCRIALMSDWGAPNIHAARLGELAIARGADYVIHLGDIYFSGTARECRGFLDRWPLRGKDDLPLPGRSFALNGNHEMYSLGGPYFDIVLKAFRQEASYFTLANRHWQLQGLDTAYVPFTLAGSGRFGAQADARLKAQSDWLEASIKAHPEKKNIFLTHHEPVSAHLEESRASEPLRREADDLIARLGAGSIFAWFFGHEHRCTIYRDDVLPYRARLIGNGSIAHHPQEETGPDRDEQGVPCTPFLKVNARSLRASGRVAVSSFALLTLDGPKIHVDFIDEDGMLFHAEDWDAQTS